MGHIGNEFPLILFFIVELQRHIIEGVGQIADFILGMEASDCTSDFRRRTRWAAVVICLMGWKIQVWKIQRITSEIRKMMRKVM